MPSSHTTQNELHWEALGKNYSNVWQPYAKQVMSSKEMHAITKTLKKNGTVLDVGVGNGRIIESLLATGTPAKIYGIDIAKKMVDICRKKYTGNAKVAQLKVCDLANQELPFTQKFSTISAIRVVKYNPNWQNMIERMARQLEPGGSMVFSMLNKRSLNFFSRYPIPIYKSSYGELVALAKKLNVEVVNIETFTRIPDVFYNLASNKIYQKGLVAAESALAAIFGKAFLGREFFVTFKNKEEPALPAGKQPLVSVIVPTKNSAPFLEACLKSIRAQTYKNIELIVVDNFSTDATPKIAKKYGATFYTKGPERSAQVNYGVSKAKGKYVYKVDSDFTLDQNVITQCVYKALEGSDAVVVHNTPDESVSWIAKIRKFEVDMYKYDHMHSSPRFLSRSTYNAIGGFNESITAGEDYDFRNKLDYAGYKTGFVEAEAVHHGEPTSIKSHLAKYFHYGKDIKAYKIAEHNSFQKETSSFLFVYGKHWKRLLRHPIKTIELFIYTLFKAIFGSAGWLIGKAS